MEYTYKIIVISNQKPRWLVSKLKKHQQTISISYMYIAWSPALGKLKHVNHICYGFTLKTKKDPKALSSWVSKNKIKNIIIEKE